MADPTAHKLPETAPAAKPETPKPVELAVQISAGAESVTIRVRIPAELSPRIARMHAIEFIGREIKKAVPQVLKTGK